MDIIGDKMINLTLYKLTQNELFNYIKGYLNALKIKFIEFDKQIISINHPNKPCFIAHLDTVNDLDMKKELIVSDDKLYRKNGILGSDDRAGVNIILNHCEDINFIFTRDEEIGCLGVREIAKLFENKPKLIKDITCFIELDRKGGNSLLSVKHGYCNEDLRNAIMDIALNEGIIFVDDIGAFTDVDYLLTYKPAVNMSVGYYNPHSNDEYLNINEYNRINNLIPLLNSGLNDVYTIVDIEHSYKCYDNIECYCEICETIITDKPYTTEYIDCICYDCFTYLQELEKKGGI